MMAVETKVPKRLYAPPWRERQPDGKLGAEYGPASAAAYARLVTRHADWSFRSSSKKALALDRLRAFMRLPDGTLRLDVPESEVRVYRLVVEQGHSVRWTAKHLGLHRESVRSYMRRLRVRAEQGEGHGE